MHKVIQRFPWSPDGYTTQRLNVGDERDFGDATASLVEAGFIERGLIINEVDSNGGNTGNKPRPNASGKRKG